MNPIGDVRAVNNEILAYLKLIATLGGVVLLAFVVLRFWLPKLSGVRAAIGGPMHVVARLVLEPRKTVYVVRAGSDYVMLAASDAGVQFIASLDAAGIEGVLNESVTDEKFR